MSSALVERVDVAEAARLRAAGVRVLDVRTAGEYEELGHVPGALLLPVDLVAAAVAGLSPDEPLLVCCEHGVRSAWAASFLLQAGFSAVKDLAGGMSVWRGEREFGPPTTHFGPNTWLLSCADLIPRGGVVLDVACGRGRHALLLAAAGFRVRGVDRDPDVLFRLGEQAERLQLPLALQSLELEDGIPDLGTGVYDAVLVVHYLHRPLFPALVRALRPGGVLIYETFTVDQAAYGRKPSNPAFLLQPGELEQLVAPLAVVRQRAGEFEGRFVEGVAAKKVAPLPGPSKAL